ncbi:MAG: alpha/beta fold hydrolase [Pseudomonadota bacterium]
MMTHAHDPKTIFILVHGSWHGAWCWQPVITHLNQAGMIALSVELPGHGLQADPLTAGQDLATMVSPLAQVPTAGYTDAVIKAARRARAMGAERVIAVGHSMGGMPITFAAAKEPALFSGLTYVCAIMPTPGKPAGAYLQTKTHINSSKIVDVLVADPAVVGSLRINPRSDDPAYQDALKQALAADMPDDLWRAVVHLLTPDAPAAFYGEEVDFTDGFAALKRISICAGEDRILGSAVSQMIIDDFNQAFADHPTQRVDIKGASHEVIFSQPERLAQNLISKI